MSADELWKKGDRCQHKRSLALGTVQGTATVFVDVLWDSGEHELITYTMLQDPIKPLEWEPAPGFCAFNENSNLELAAALEIVRRRVCAYNWGTRDEDVRCDCKYGATPEEARSMGSERTGCPELREVIYRLLHKPESFGADHV